MPAISLEITTLYVFIGLLEFQLLRFLVKIQKTSVPFSESAYAIK
jgi:hypothetical protein